jgi:hypothetical protein
MIGPCRDATQQQGEEEHFRSGEPVWAGDERGSGAAATAEWAGGSMKVVHLHRVPSEQAD